MDLKKGGLRHTNYLQNPFLFSQGRLFLAIFIKRKNSTLGVNFLFKYAHRCSIEFKSTSEDMILKGCLDSHCFILLLMCIGASSY